MFYPSNSLAKRQCKTLKASRLIVNADDIYVNHKGIADFTILEYNRLELKVETRMAT